MKITNVKILKSHIGAGTKSGDFAQRGGRYTKHIYIGSQRIVSKLGDFDSYGADPRRVEKAGESFSGVKVNYDAKYKKALDITKSNYDSFEVPYYGVDNNDYVNGLGFCCNPSGETSSSSATGKMTAKNDNAELQQFYYHPDHLGSSSYITNLDGEVVQHIEYVPFGEVFLEEKNAKWNTPYLFASKELDSETGMYYYGARYMDPKLSIFLGVDPLAQMFPGRSSYEYCFNNPVNLIDPTGMGPGDPETHTVAKGDNLSTISRKYGVSISDIQKMNGIKDVNKIKPGQVLNVNPEANFSVNPRGGYQNPDNAHGEEVSVSNIANVGFGFVAGTSEENQIITGGGALKSVQNWSVVKSMVKKGLEDLETNGFAPGASYSASFSPGDLPSNIKKGLKEAWNNIKNGENPLKGNSQNTPIHVLGSFNFTLRVNPDGKTATVCIYDSKTFRSFVDNKGGTNRSRSNSESTILTNTYQRYLWNVKRN